MVVLMVIILSVNVIVEVGLPGYELSKLPNMDYPSF